MAADVSVLGSRIRAEFAPGEAVDELSKKIAAEIESLGAKWAEKVWEQGREWVEEGGAAIALDAARGVEEFANLCDDVSCDLKRLTEVLEDVWDSTGGEVIEAISSLF